MTQATTSSSGASGGPYDPPGSPFAPSSRETSDDPRPAPPPLPSFPSYDTTPLPSSAPAGGSNDPFANAPADPPGAVLGQGSGPPGGPSQPGKGRGRSNGRGPGWRGVIAVGAGATLLSSLLTAGAVTALQDNNSTQVTASSSQSGGTTTNEKVTPQITGTSSSPNWEEVAAAVEPSVVSIQVTSNQGSGEGSGIIMDTSGHVLTNNHVVEGAGSDGVSVVLSDGRTYPATIVGTDQSTDLAVVKMTNPPSDLTAARFGDSSAVKVGQPVMALGNPLGLSDTVTTGIVSALNRPVITTGSQSQSPFGGGGSSDPVVTNAIQTDAAINPGNSGGALVDGSGAVIGINSSIASLSDSQASSQSGSIGLGFAIPVNEATAVAKELIANGKATHAYIGVGIEDGKVTVNGAQRQAAVLTSISSGGPAAKAGLKQGDSVIALNGQTLDGAESFIARIRAARPGTEVTLTIVRDGKQQDVKATLAVRPTDN